MIEKERKKQMTLLLKCSSIEDFRQECQKIDVSYSRKINRLMDGWVKRQRETEKGGKDVASRQNSSV